MPDALLPVQVNNVERHNFRKEAVMKTMRMLISMMAGSASVAFAAAETQGSEMGILTYLFIGFFAVVIVFQLVPAMVLFVGMVKGLFSRQQQKSPAKAD